MFAMLMAKLTEVTIGPECLPKLTYLLKLQNSLNLLKLLKLVVGVHKLL